MDVQGQLSSTDTFKSSVPEGARRFYFIGIGGAGMSGLALVLHKRGYEVSGSDLKPSRYVTLLREAGISVHIGHRASNLNHPDVVVVSSAIPPHNVELVEALQKGIPVVKRGQLLAWLVNQGRGIAVLGAHGKTTTTSMISRVLVDSGLAPTFLVGGELNDLGSNADHGDGEYVVCEADESDGSFLFLHPEVAVVTNLDLDHHSHYLHLEDLEKAFACFAAGLPQDGLFVYYQGDPRLERLARKAPCRTLSYGLSDAADYHAREVVLDHQGSKFEVWRGSQRLVAVSLIIPGVHNIQNALACFSTLVELGVSPEQIASSLSSFSGAVRRFQWKGSKDGVTVIDDYAHHPTELQATLRTARRGPWRRIIAVFQPHLYSRTEFLHEEFARALLEADIAVVTDVYGAREAPRPGISGKLIVDSLLKQSANKHVVYLPRLGWVVEYLRKVATPGDLVLTLGAGDVHRVGERFLANS